MTNFGIDQNGFNLKRAPEIKIDLEVAVRSAIGSDALLTPDTPEGAMIEYFTQTYADLWQQLQGAYSAFSPLAATGQTLDNLVWLNGLSRLPALQSVATLTVTGTQGTVVPAGSIVRHNVNNAEFITESAVTIPAGGNITVNSKSRLFGEIAALTASLTIIETPINGWTSVTNLTDAVIGRNSETDEQLRQRRNASLLIAGQASLESIVGNVAKLDGVVQTEGVENFTNAADGNGLPPHSFEIVVLGGTDENIAQTIWIKKPVGIEANGTTSVVVKDVFGNDHTISFTRPASITLYLRANITFPGSVPDNADTVITQNILDYVSGILIPGVLFGISDDISASRMYQPINMSYGDLIINSLDISIDGTNWTTATEAIEFNELSAWDAARINLTIG